MGSSLDRLAAQAAGDTTSTGEPQPNFDPSSALDRLAQQAERLASARRAMRRMLPNTPAVSTTPTPTESGIGKFLREAPGAALNVVEGIPKAIGRMATSAYQDVNTLARAMPPSAGVGSGVVEDPTMLAARRAQAPSPSDVLGAGLRTGALAAAGPIAGRVGSLAEGAGLGALASRLMGNAAAGGVVGAVDSPAGERIKGAALGAGLGAVVPEAISGAARLGGRVAAPVANAVSRAMTPAAPRAPIIDPDLDFSAFAKPPAKIVLPPEVQQAIAAHPGPAPTEPGAPAPITAHDNVPAPEPEPTPTPALDGLQERFSVVPLATGARTALGQKSRELFSNRYDMLGAPEHQPLQEAVKAAGAGRSYGQAVADLGVGSARHGIEPETVKRIEAQLYADNALSAANDAEAKAQALDPTKDGAAMQELATRAENFRRIQADAQAEAGPDIRQSPEYAQYVARYKQLVEPRFEDVARAVGVTGGGLRSVQPGSAYVPFAPETENTGILPAPSSAVGVKQAKFGTKTSSAAQTATGAAQQYRYDVAQNVAPTLGERARVAGGNRIVNEVVKLGQPVTDPKAPVPDGMARVKITDSFGLAPDAGTVRTFDVPLKVKDALDVATQRLTPGPTTSLQRVLEKVRHVGTGLDLAVRPAVLAAHGLKNIGSLAGQIPSGSALDDLAASLVPGYAHAEGLGRLATSHPLEPENADALLNLAETGGLHPVENHQGLLHATSRPLFGAEGLDMRVRLLMDRLLRKQAPHLTAAQRAQVITEQAGNYVPENQPAFQHFGQSTGLTSFAPAGVSFVRGSARRMVGAQLYPGQTLGSRLATMGRIGGSGLATLEALNYANSGHSTFSNEPGHRLDVDRGKKDAQGREEYLAGSAIEPLLTRALRATGAEGVINSERPADIPLNAYRDVVNTGLSQAGVGTRAGLGFFNVAPYLTSTGEAKVNVQPDMQTFRMPFRITQGALGGMATGAAALGGFDPYNANEPLAQRISDWAVGRVTTTGRGPKSISPGLDDKIVGAMRAVEAADPKDKGTVTQQQMQGARDQHYPPWAMKQLSNALRAAAHRK